MAKIVKVTKSPSVAILTQAQDIITGDRRKAYGPAKESFICIADYWSRYLGHSVTSRDVAIMMVLFKVAREANSHKTDNLVDIAGYAALAEECEDE